MLGVVFWEGYIVNPGSEQAVRLEALLAAHAPLAIVHLLRSAKDIWLHSPFRKARAAGGRGIGWRSMAASSPRPVSSSRSRPPSSERRDEPFWLVGLSLAGRSPVLATPGLSPSGGCFSLRVDPFRVKGKGLLACAF